MVKIKNLKFKKKILSFIVGYVLMTFPGNSKSEVLASYKYSNGTIYIVNSLCDNKFNDNDMVVLDERNNRDPNVKIIDSYRINDEKLMVEIIQKLLQYESENPSKWNRLPDSLVREWQIHNECYKANCMTESTKDVDFNNNDGKIFDIVCVSNNYESEYVNNNEIALYELLDKDYIGYYEYGNEIFRGLYASYSFIYSSYKEEIDNSDLMDDSQFRLMKHIFDMFEINVKKSSDSCYDDYCMCLPGYRLLLNTYKDRIKKDFSREKAGDILEYYKKQINRILVSLSLIKNYNFDYNLDSREVGKIENVFLNTFLGYIGNMLDIEYKLDEELIRKLDKEINFYNELIDRNIQVDRDNEFSLHNRKVIQKVAKWLYSKNS